MAEFREGEYIIYQNGDRFEIGKIKRLTDDGAFVWYHSGETASKTPFDCMHKLVNGYTIKRTTLGAGKVQEAAAEELIEKSTAIEICSGFERRARVSKEHSATFIDAGLWEASCATAKAIGKTIAAIKPADVDPAKHGGWVDMRGYAGREWLCSNCGSESMITCHGKDVTQKWGLYCPQCGARMDLKVDIKAVEHG